MDKVQDIMSRWEALQPLSAQKQHSLNQRFTIDFNYNTNRIEGYQLTYFQTEMLVMFKKVVGEAEIADVEEMMQSDKALKMMTAESHQKDIPLTQNFIRTLHKTLLREDYTVYRNLPGSEITSYVIHAGQYKTRPNSVITRYGDRFDYASPEETPALMSDLVEWYNKAEEAGKLSPVELAAIFHYRYIRIHPFEDGNGRIARLMVNYILSRHGWPMIVVRNSRKLEYLDALHETDEVVGPSPSAGAHATKSKAVHFVKYFKRLVAKELSYYIDFATETSPDVWWYDGDRITFRNPSSSRILDAMQCNPDITIKDLAQEAGVSVSAVNKQLSLMTAKGYIQRRAGDDGSWHILATRSI